jgi:hypothetical protein
MAGVTDNQWRIDSAAHLRGAVLRFRPYRRWSETWDHDHCAACWAKFAENEIPDALHEGFATEATETRGAGYDWVCPTCFAELKTEMQWTAAEAPPPRASQAPVGSE